MPGQSIDHAGLETLPFETCLRLLDSVPVGRLGFYSDGELVILPVNHVMDGQDVIFATVAGSKLTAAEGQALVAFEADDYDEQTRTGWSVLVNGRAEVMYDEAEIQRLRRSGQGPDPWVTGVPRTHWIRVRPTSVTGRHTPARTGSGG
jgi:nitroimidazol reductase NimA-like FMN-containing flavoprotein (pyridoxamine 5'-phosphate oxidase superfamily)